RDGADNCRHYRYIHAAAAAAAAAAATLLPTMLVE
ncbi:unnamed protein product, partial [Rotaria magnacalcarata]